MHKQKVFEFCALPKGTKGREPKKTSYLFDSRRASLLTMKNVRLLNLQKIIFKEVLLLSSRTICFRDCIVRSICNKIELRQDWFISKTAPSALGFYYLDWTKINLYSFCSWCEIGYGSSLREGDQETVWCDWKHFPSVCLQIKLAWAQ